MKTDPNAKCLSVVIEVSDKLAFTTENWLYFLLAWSFV